MLEIKRILCPIDFSEFSVRAYYHSLSLAEHYRAKMVALHVIELFRFTLYESACRAIRESSQEQLQEFVKQHTHNEVQPELEVHEGTAPDFILWFAQAQKADLIVMGTHGRRGYDRLMLGSVTDRVMRRTSCPVLAVSKPTPDSIAAGTERGHAHRLSRILFCTDFSENSERALKYAISATEEYMPSLPCCTCWKMSRGRRRRKRP